MNEKIEKMYQERPRTWIYHLAIVLVVVAVLCWSGTSIEFKGVSQRGAMMAANIFKGIFHPATDILFNLSKESVAYLLLETVCIALIGTIVGSLIAVPFSFLAATKIMPRPVAWLGTLLIMGIRTIPAFVYGLMIIRVTGPGAFAGVLTMSICSIGMVSKMYIEAIENLDTSVLESLDAMGCGRFAKIRYGILPQLFSNFVSTAIYRFDINLKDATVLGLVGAGGIGAPLIFAMNSYKWNEVGSLLIGLIILVLLVEWISTKIRVGLARG